MTCAQGLLRLLWGRPEVGVLRDCLLRDLIKFISKNKDSQAYVDGNMESTVTSNSNWHALYSFIDHNEKKKKWRRRRTTLRKCVAKLLLHSFRENMLSLRTHQIVRS